ncbi:hypothetical protein TIFTF001_006498 [Ficus carica]|uniref:Uncharacterized protein n=1 Tax=Ficus carica TaxID=3494 RepID=A0AA88CYS5_FICCA|nr:hypothetical protein TIFTF001_006498 [Ficus carica]
MASSLSSSLINDFTKDEQHCKCKENSDSSSCVRNRMHRKEMVMVSRQFIWENLKRDNFFLLKEFRRWNLSIQFITGTLDWQIRKSSLFFLLVNTTVLASHNNKDQEQGEAAALLHKSITEEEFRMMLMQL